MVVDAAVGVGLDIVDMGPAETEAAAARPAMTKLDLL